MWKIVKATWDLQTMPRTVSAKRYLQTVVVTVKAA